MSTKIVVKGYHIGPKVDESGLKVVYQALNLKSGKEVFLTLISARQGPSLQALARRSKLSQQLLHPRIVSAIDYGMTQEEKFYYEHKRESSYPVIFSLEEEDLEGFDAVYYAIQTLELLEYIHEAGSTHREVNSTNIRIDRKKRVLLEGFINARPKIEPHNIANIVNLPYIAPEQLSGHPADARTDIYSLGVVLFEWITGVVPYDSNFSKLEDTRQGIVPAPSLYKIEIAPELEAIIMKALSPRSSRYRHAREMIEALETFHSKRSMRQKLKDFSDALKMRFVT